MIRFDRTFHVLLSVGLLASVPLAQGADDCTMAQVISGMGFFSFDNNAATIDGPSDCPVVTGTNPVRKDVWFRWTAPNDDLYEISTCNLTALGTRIAVYQGTSCPPTLLLSCEDNVCGAQTTVTFPTIAGQEYLFRVGSRQIGQSGTGMFEVRLSTICPGMTDDNREPNDFCLSSLPITGNGTANNLFVRKFDDDWYAYEVASGGTLTVDVTFIHANGDIDTRLYDGCGGSQIAASTTGTDDERIIWTNTGPCTTVYQRVYHWSGDTNDCTTYGLTVAGAGSCTATQIGTPYCTTNANSSGNAASISAMGSVTLADQNVVLTATGAPNDTVGLFFFGSNSAQTPFGQGVRCVRGRVYRMPPFVVTGPMNGNPTGEASLNVDFTGANYSAALVPGQMNFQFWFQDTVGGSATFNLSDGVQIPFQ